MAPDPIRGFDHVSLPMQNTDAMIAFYRALGFTVVEHRSVVSVHFGDQMINLHRPELWPREAFTLRAPAAVPPCGDLCFVWSDTAAALDALLAAVGAPVIEGPVAREGARRVEAMSVYVRDPDQNLLEFMMYPSGDDTGSDAAGDRHGG